MKLCQQEIGSSFLFCLGTSPSKKSESASEEEINISARLKEIFAANKKKIISKKKFKTKNMCRYIIL
jgi:hypothetical protein